MKLKHWVIVLAIGFIAGFLGAWMKIMHRSSADLLLTISMILKGVGVLFLSIKVINNPRLKDLMNS